MDDPTGDSPTIASTLSGGGGPVAGRYRVRGRLGRGATKEVYLAYDERLDREVALAIVVGAVGNDVARARVVREAQVTGRLGDHPNVITVYDTGDLDNVPYLVLRAMSGGSLAAALARERPSIAAALRIGREIAAALAHAHAHAVVHRDVKPDNVWLAADGTAALGDFGIAHVAGADHLTAEGVVLGTVRYLSPEQIRGEPASPASDLYALGVTLYELVAGRPPFTAADPSHVLTQHLTAAPEPPSRHVPEIAPALDELILSLLAKQPDRRPPGAATVGAALSQLAAAQATAGEAHAGTAAPRAEHTREPGARRLVAVLAARAEIADPEVLHGVLERCTTVIERHGGTVEHLLGDALVAVFGLAGSHGDDALRATRAAVELRAASDQLRLGVESGEVFLAAGARGITTTTGAPITAAGRLADRAAAGEILLGADARAAVAPEARIEETTGRLIELHLDQPGLLRTPATPFVGRARELEQMLGAYTDARDASACRLVTVAGPPGIGKSRLAGEFLISIGEQPTVLAGRCLAYGEGTTYRALADIVRGLGGEPRARVSELLGGDEQAIRGILGAIGLSEYAAQAEETAWALRRLLERLARERPLVVVIEDIHWAEPLLLDVFDHLLALSSGAPILLVCLTRPELLESRPAWASPQPNRSLLVLDALSATDAQELAEALGATLAPRIAQRAEGNPLFLEQLVAVDTGQDTGELPASIQAVLAARIDRLEPGERTLLQRAAVEGRTFHAGALATLLSDDERRGIPSRLVTLARKGLLGADRSHFTDEDAFRFTHALIREAAYAGLPKLLRTDLHARVADWLEQRPAAADEIVGFHLEQAALLATELGRAGAGEHALAIRAGRRLEAASDAALARGDAAAASALLARAVALLAFDEAARAALLPSLGAALFEAGQMADAGRVLDEAIARSSEPRVRARAQVEREFMRLETETSTGTEQVRLIADAALEVLEREDDDRGRARVWSLRAQISYIAGQMGDADAALQRAAEYATGPGHERELFETLAWRANAAVFGPTAVAEAISRCQAFRTRVAASPVAEAWIINPLAVLHAMNGEFELAETMLAEADAILAGLGGLTANVSHLEATVRFQAGQPALAEAALRADVDALGSLERNDALVTSTAMLAEAVFDQGRVDEADVLCRQAARATSPDDIHTIVMLRALQGAILARQDRCAEAEQVANEAVSLSAPTDLLMAQGDAMLRLAEVLRHCSRAPSTTWKNAVREGLALYELKGNVTAVHRARSLLTDETGAT